MTGRSDGIAPVKLIIHAGMGKAGSSAIQVFLRKNRAALREAGVVYLGKFFDEIESVPEDEDPGMRFRRALTAGPAHLRSEFDRLFELADRSLADARAHTMLMSLEGLFRHPQLVGPILAPHLARYESRFVVYLRRQDEWFVSAYKEWGIKQKPYEGKIESFEEWFARNRSTGNFLDLLAAWDELIGRELMHVRIYDRVPDAARDFAEICGIEDLASERREVNASDSLTALALYKLHHAQFEGPGAAQELGRLLGRAGLSRRETVPVAPELELPDSERRRGLLAEFSEQNQGLGRYLSTDHAEGFPESSEPVEAVRDVDQSQVIAALLLMVVQLERDLQAAMERLGALEGTD